MLEPLHTDGTGGVTVTTNEEATVTVTVCVEVHPPPLSPVTVYVVVEPGLAVTLVPVVWFRPVAGLHVYVVAPLAVSTTLPPGHIAGAAGVTLTVGVGVIVIATDCVALQPAAVVPVTVYVIELPGVAVTLAVLVALKPVEGLQVYVPPPPAPLAVSTTEPPLQKVVEPVGVIVIVGFGLTVTVTCCVEEQPDDVVPVTV